MGGNPRRYSFIATKMQRPHSRRRARSGSSVAVYRATSKQSLQPAQLVSSSKNLHMASTQRRRPPREPALTISPSSLWTSLPLSVKIIVFVTGFLALYYVIFAKHKTHDMNFKKMKEIHKELEEILKKANESGFMDKNVSEAVLPAIFRDSDNSSSPSNRTLSESPATKLDNNTAESSQAKGSEKEKTGQKKKRRKRKSAPKSAEEVKEADSDTKTSNKDLGPADASDGNATNQGPPTEKSDPSEASSSSQTTPKDATSTAPESSGSQNASASSATKDSSPDSAGMKNSAVPEPVSPNTTDAQNTAVGATREATSASGQTRFPPQFEDVVGTQSPNGSLPILNWNPEAIMNESIPEQIFGLGSRLDHVAMYKPLCLDTVSGEGIIFEGETVCGGFNRTEEWMNHYCSAMKSDVQKEFLLKMQEERKSKEWLEQNSESIEWVTGVTLLQVLEKNCGNIAHFSGRALMLQHVIENVGSYAAPPSDIANILILPTFHVMKRFLYPERYVHWHTSLVRSLVAPSKLEMGDLGNFLSRAATAQKPNEPLVQLLHNFSLANSQFENKKYVCFKRALIPGYLKGRFFVNDIEYPSTKPSFEFPAEDAPPIPRDSLRMRERVSSLVEQTPEIRTMQKEIVLIDRKGTRRVFDEARKPDIVQAFEQVAKKHGYTFKIITFENADFGEQYKAVSSASIAVGIHGANLVNTMFMPPLSVLIELFPYGFVHDMYRHGGNAGLKYYSYQMSTGKKFDGPNVFRTPEQCVRLNQKCKVHYRDAILQVTDDDIVNMTKILEDAVGWCDKLPAPSKYSGEPARKRRLLLRRLLDHVVKRRKPYP